MILAAITAVALSQNAGGTFVTTDKPNTSPRNMITEIKLGSYYPWVDRPLNCGGTTGNACPYASVLQGAMLLVELEVERQLFQAFGTAALGASLGYAEKYGHAIANGMATGEATSLRVLPMRLLASYRFDWPMQKWNVPLVPYVKLGFQLTHWWTTGASGTEIAADKTAGGGWSYGVVGTGGLAFMLDILDPRLARDFDTGMGVNHTYLFAEYNIAEINNFGRKEEDGVTAYALDLSARYFMFGLAFEY